MELSGRLEVFPLFLFGQHCLNVAKEDLSAANLKGSEVDM